MNSVSKHEVRLMIPNFKNHLTDIDYKFVQDKYEINKLKINRFVLADLLLNKYLEIK